MVARRVFCPFLLKIRGEKHLKSVVKLSGKDNATIKANVENARPVPAWLELNNETLSGKVVRLASREDVDIAIEEHLIVELYSK